MKKTDLQEVEKTALLKTVLDRALLNNQFLVSTISYFPGWHGGLMVSMLDSVKSSSGFSLGRSPFVLLRGKNFIPKVPLITQRALADSLLGIAPPHTLSSIPYRGSQNISSCFMLCL